MAFSTTPRGEPHCGMSLEVVCYCCFVLLLLLLLFLGAVFVVVCVVVATAADVVVVAALTIDVVAADVTAAAMLGLPRDREPLLRRSYPNEPTYQGYPEGGAARDPVPKAASARRCGSIYSERCLCLR